MSLQSKKQLIEIFWTCQKNIKLNIVFRSSNRIRDALLFKDQIPKYMNSKVIYKFKCNLCNDVYIGETKRHFLARFRFKDQIPKYMNSKVIYKFKCNICNDVYIGETKRHFLVREYEHLGKSILPEKNLKYTEKMLLLLESIVTTMVIQLIHSIFN